MKILFLDDDKKRHAYFRFHFGKWDVTYTWTAKEALQALRDNTFDLASLDHDLEGEVHVPSGPGTGWEVAKAIADLPKDKQPRHVIVHSYSISAPNMTRTMMERNVPCSLHSFGFEGYVEYLTELIGA